MRHGAHRNTVMEPPGAVSRAAQQGTTFVIEDLFYNMDQRSKVCGAPGMAIQLAVVSTG